VAISTIIIVTAVVIGFLIVFSSGNKAGINILPGDITDQLIEQEVISGQKIRAIKLYRSKYKTGLKEAKEAIDRIQDDLELSGQIKS
jgi:ribosomal protein L7/L12